MELLKGNLVYLKLVEEQDLEKRVEWLNDPLIQYTLNYDTPTSLSKTKKWFDKNIFDSSRRDFSVFTVENNQYIGFGGFVNIQYPVMKAEIYCVIGDKSFWGKEYGLEVMKVLTDYGFNELGLNRIYAYQLKHNYGIHKIVEKLGWQREGLLRQDFFSHGKIIDRYIVSILRSEWEKDQEVNSLL